MTLATARPTDLWYLEATRLRADWRIKVTSPGLQPRFAWEATRLIDNAIALYQDPDLYSMRVAAAFVADDASERHRDGQTTDLHISATRSTVSKKAFSTLRLKPTT